MIGDIFFQLSVRSVKLNFTRSILASIGIVIGVVAISAMGMLGTNMSLQVEDQLSSSANTIVITADAIRMGPPGSSSSASYISKTQLNKIKSAVGTNGTVIPLYSTTTQFTSGNVQGRGSIYGMNPDDVNEFLTIGNGTNIAGINEALIGLSLSESLGVEVGDRIKVSSASDGPPTNASSSASRATLTIAGIIDDRGTVADSVSTDNGIVVSKEWYTAQYDGKDEYTQVNVIVDDTDMIAEIEDAIDAKINTDEKKPSIRITDASSQLDTISSTLSTLTTFCLAIGGISLIVAAVSIFNVMMMSVNERVQEIGILLSIGTETGEVRRMFLYEAFILGIVGSGIGGLMSVVIGYSVVDAMIGTTEFFFMPSSIIYVPAGMVVGMVVCVISGLYPAWRASNMDPIDALRSD
ncbi:ABC transporter permease [Methanoregula sp.]|uniref:ABC transporter permease n=1 Tax=Methanoregula sp. TaxID=2052170 RepID=UPI002374F85F|nr:ABC transporter permease [Methanoregula sp.]MDD1687418.1 ABC transporter permease [Methanoregula sp.]